MTIDFQGYKNNKEVFHRSNLWWTDAFDMLEQKRSIPVDKVDVQIYTDDTQERMMPIDSKDNICSIEEAQIFINKCYEKIIKKEYKGIRYD